MIYEIMLLGLSLIDIILFTKLYSNNEIKIYGNN